jgi:hypothetical protein
MPPRVAGERDAVDQLHREEPLVAFRQQLVQRDEVPVRDVGERSEFLLEAVEGGGVDVAQRLQRDRLIPLAIERFVDDAEAAGAEAAADLEACIAGELALDKTVTFNPNIPNRVGQGEDS